MSEEIWKDIPDWENYYQVSDQGRVRGVDRYIKHWRGGESLWKGRLLNLSEDPNEYLRVNLKREGRVRRYWVHI